MKTKLQFLLSMLAIIALLALSGTAAADSLSGDLHTGTGVERYFDHASPQTPYKVFLPMVFRNFCGDFQDDFSNPASGWPVGDSDQVLAEYLNGEYRVLVKPAYSIYPVHAPTCNRENYSVEVKARWGGNPGLAYALAFGVVGNFERFYALLVGTSESYPAQWALVRYDAGAQAVLGSGSLGFVGFRQTTLSVLRSGTLIRVCVDGSCTNLYDGAITGPTGVGLGVASSQGVRDADARFDDFKVASASPSATQAAAPGSPGPSQKREFGWRLPEDLYERLKPGYPQP